MFTSKKILIIICFGFTIIACKNEVKTEDTNKIPAVKETESIASKNNTTLYPWVDNLNIRDLASTKGKTITTVKQGDALIPLGAISDHKETIVLRGVAYYEPWIKVTTKDDKIGWVFGGTVKKVNEIKGNEIITDTNFDFPHFGKYDLSTWKNISTKDESGGDAEIETTIYKRGNQTITMSISEVGEYGYGRDYILKVNDTIQKQRSFHFTADYEFSEITESVKDFSQNPPKQYNRSQPVETHFMQLNAKPIMVNGTWTTTNLDSKKDKH